LKLCWYSNTKKQRGIPALAAQTLFFERSEGNLAYSDYGGSGEPILMLPGLGALRSEHRFLDPKLDESGYRAITIDRRGHGESSVPWKAYDIPSVGGDILALVEHIGAGPAHIIASSFSAGAAVWAAAENPDSVRSLILIGGSVRNGKVNPFLKPIYWLMMNNPWRVRTWIMYYRTLYPSRKPDDFAEYLNDLSRNLAQKGRFAAAAALASCSRSPSQERLGRVRAHTLIIMGTRDPDFPDPSSEGKFIAEKTGGRLELIQGAGHYPQSEMPEITTPLIIGFLRLSKV
jgi:pimeloyl-ACP methyl ester carboxylesterase